MKVVIIGATGTIGSAVSTALSVGHDIIRAGATRGDLTVDLGSQPSIRSLFGATGRVDAVVCTAGRGAFGPFQELSDDDFALGIGNKLMGQVNLVRIGLEHVSDAGSFTLTSGALGREPTSGVAALSLVNGALESFARAAALDMPRGVRINAVSPPWVKETMEAMGMDSSPGMPAADVAKAYVESVEGRRTGEVLDCADFLG